MTSRKRFARASRGSAYERTYNDVPKSEGEALEALYNATAGDSWTDNANWLTSYTVNDWYGVTVAGGHVTELDLGGNNLNGSLAGWQLNNLPYLTNFRLDTNASLSGNIGDWTLPASLEVFYIYSTSVSGDISSWTLPASLEVYYIFSTSVSGDVGNWVLPAVLRRFYIFETAISGDISGWNVSSLVHTVLQWVRIDNTSVDGDISGWTLPASLEVFNIGNTSLSGDISGWILPAAMVNFYIYSTSVSGDISSWVLPASLMFLLLFDTLVSGDISSWTLPASLYYFWIENTSLSNAPIFTSAVVLESYQQHDCSLIQAHVDAILQGIYNRRASFTHATPSVNVGGTGDTANAAPSGVYQDGDPPSSGLEYVYEIANDPEVEGFNTWSVTWNGGTAP